jgi:hypothetical protein
LVSTRYVAGRPLIEQAASGKSINSSRRRSQRIGDSGLD